MLMYKINKSYYEGAHRHCPKKRIRIVGPESRIRSHILVEVGPAISNTDFMHLQNAWQLFCLQSSNAAHHLTFACTGSLLFPYTNGALVPIDKSLLYSEKWKQDFPNMRTASAVPPYYTFPGTKLTDFMIDSGFGDIRLQESNMEGEVNLVIDNEDDRALIRIALA